jgi:hypothetical protein
MTNTQTFLQLLNFTLRLALGIILLVPLAIAFVFLILSVIFVLCLFQIVNPSASTEPYWNRMTEMLAKFTGGVYGVLEKSLVFIMEFGG